MSENIRNKVVFNGETLIDLTIDTIEQSDILAGKFAHLPSGERVEGTCPFDADTSDATAKAAEILAQKTAYVNGNKITGSMPNVGAQNPTIADKDDEITISKGFHDGSGKAKLDATEKAKLIPGNIKTGVEILGVEGTYTGSELIKATTGSATPAATAQTILPSGSGDFDFFTQFTVAAIPYVETQNAAGGYTVTIG